MFELFLPFDTAMLSFMHILAENASFILSPIFSIISLLGKKGCIVLVIGFLLLLNKRTRKYGVAMIGSLAISYIMNDMIVKNIVQRVRPFEANKIFNEYLMYVGADLVDEYSFPSGHVTGIASGFFAFVFMLKKGASKKYLIIAIISPIIMSFARMYFMHHYPTDCIAGYLTGILYAYIGSLITKFIYSIMKKNKNFPLFKFVLEWSLFGK